MLCPLIPRLKDHCGREGLCQSQRSFEHLRGSALTMVVTACTRPVESQGSQKYSMERKGRQDVPSLAEKLLAATSFGGGGVSFL